MGSAVFRNQPSRIDPTSTGPARSSRMPSAASAARKARRDLPLAPSAAAPTDTAAGTEIEDRHSLQRQAMEHVAPDRAGPLAGAAPVPENRRPALDDNVATVEASEPE